MATTRYFFCTSCDRPSDAGGMLDTLRALANGEQTPCEKCSRPMELRMSFPFAFDAERGDRCIVGAFAPRKPVQWRDSKAHDIEFIPFLVISDALDGSNRTAWLPYWHTDTSDGSTRQKYGQWAPHMDLEIFLDLLDQARERGLLGPGTLE